MSDDPVTEIIPNDKVLHLQIQRRTLDEVSTRELVDDVLTAAGANPGLTIVLDMSKVKFAPSVALGSLVQMSKSFKFDQRRIVLIGIDRRVMQAIRVTQLHKILEIHPSLDRVISD